MAQSLGLRQPPSGTARTVAQAEEVARSIGLPVLVRPSYVLGGRAMEIVHEFDHLRRYMENAIKSSPEHPVLIDKFLDHAIEVDGSKGSGEIYNVTYVFRTDNGVDFLDTWFGRYLDQYENRNGEWRIIERICVHENTTSQSIDSHMPIDSAKFRHGSIDRGTATPLGY